jgi:hypothetical protein
MRFADALRLAQLWILDPGRDTPAPLGHLPASRNARRDVTQWAAFTHMGM